MLTQGPQDTLDDVTRGMVRDALAATFPLGVGMPAPVMQPQPAASVAVTDPHADRLAARTRAEDRLQRDVLDDELSCALAYHLLRLAGWTTDRATRVLKASGWWMS